MASLILGKIILHRRYEVLCSREISAYKVTTFVYHPERHIPLVHWHWWLAYAVSLCCSLQSFLLGDICHPWITCDDRGKQAF